MFDPASHVNRFLMKEYDIALLEEKGEHWIVGPYGNATRGFQNNFADVVNNAIKVTRECISKDLHFRLKKFGVVAPFSDISHGKDVSYVGKPRGVERPTCICADAYAKNLKLHKPHSATIPVTT